MDLIIIRYKQEMQITLQNKTGENLSMSENVRQVQVILMYVGMNERFSYI